MKYGVVVYYSFDPDVTIYLLDDYAKAQQYLHDLWEEGYNQELAESLIDIDEEETYHEDDYAQIQWADGDYMCFVLKQTCEPIEINGKTY